MPDMLAPLLQLPPLAPLLGEYEKKGIRIRRAMVPDMRRVTGWVLTNFGEHWASECEICFSRRPVSCFIAVESGEIAGFACYEATNLDFFGPIGVLESRRSLGIGKGLLIAALHGMREMGYAYAIIGGVGPIPFYEKAVGATLIPESYPGIYADLLPE